MTPEVEPKIAPLKTAKRELDVYHRFLRGPNGYRIEIQRFLHSC